MHNEPITSSLVLYLGIKRHGKTTEAFNRVKNERFIFLDPRGQIQSNGLVFGVEREKTLPIKKLQEFFDHKIPNLILNIPRGECEKLFSILRKMSDDRILMDFWLVVDESQYFTDKHYIQPDLEELVATGGQNRLNLVFIIRDAHEVNRFIRSQADEIISFKQNEPEALKWCARYCQDSDKQLPTLDYFEWIYLKKLAPKPQFGLASKRKNR